LGTFLISAPFMIIIAMILIILEVGAVGLVAPGFFIFGAYF